MRALAAWVAVASLCGCGDDAAVCTADYQRWPLTVEVVHGDLWPACLDSTVVTVTSERSGRAVAYTSAGTGYSGCVFIAPETAAPFEEDGQYRIRVEHPDYGTLSSAAAPRRHACEEYWEPLVVTLELVPVG